MNKKFGIIFFLLVVLPVLGFWFRNNLIRDYGAPTNNKIGFVLLIIGIVGNLVIIILNSRLVPSKSFWYTLPVVTGIALGIFLLFYFKYRVLV